MANAWILLEDMEVVDIFISWYSRKPDPIELFSNPYLDLEIDQCAILHRDGHLSCPNSGNHYRLIEEGEGGGRIR